MPGKRLADHHYKMKKNRNQFILNKQSQQQIHEKEDFLGKYEDQFETLRYNLQLGWEDYGTEKRKREIREMMIKAWYIINERQQ